MARPKLLVSACLLGTNCRYSGDGCLLACAPELMKVSELVPVCPEILGGLPTPRPPAECRGDRVVTRDGADVTDAYARGAREVLRLARLFDARFALLKERSPSCGAGEIYDGSFGSVRVPGDGVTARALKAAGVRVFGEARIPELIEALREEER